MIEVKGLVKKYGSHTAVDHLNFRIEKGHIYGLLGPNGAGKSTTMNIMTGYLGATEGEVLIDGHDILKEPELAKKSVGYLPEMPPLYMEMKVEEYLMFAAELKKVARNSRKAEVKKIMKMVKIYDVRERLIKNLSKGYRQRVGLAQAVLGFPETIILDEPTVGLDPKQIIEIRELIRELAKDHTVILSSHILAEIREVCDYIIIISQGKLVASDTPENLERQFAGTEPVEIETRLLPERTEEILSGISGIQKVTYLSGDPGITKAVIETDEDTDIREEVFQAFAREDCSLISMYKKQHTLEDIFLRLTQEGGRPHAGNL